MTRLLARMRRGEALTEIGIVDIHGHLGRTEYPIPDLTSAGLVRTMDRLGVRSIVCSHIQCLSLDQRGGNREILAATRAFPGRILGYASLWPWGPEEVRAEAAHCLAEEGFVGLKIHNSTGFSYTDASFAPALELANERRLIVLLHTWGREAEMAEVRALAGRYAEAAFVLAHSGAQGREEVYIKAAREFANVYLDPTLSLSPPGMVERLVAGAGAAKVVWGSDAYFLDMAQQLGKVLGSELSEEDTVRVLATNARGLLERVRHLKH